MSHSITSHDSELWVLIIPSLEFTHEEAEESNMRRSPVKLFSFSPSSIFVSNFLKLIFLFCGTASSLFLRCYTCTLNSTKTMSHSCQLVCIPMSSSSRTKAFKHHQLSSLVPNFHLACSRCSINNDSG